MVVHAHVAHDVQALVEEDEVVALAVGLVHELEEDPRDARVGA